MSRLGRSQPIQPSAWHGFVDPGPGPVGTTPPAGQFVPLDADRHHLRPALQPFVAAHGFVDSGVGAPGTTPPEPVSLDRLDQRARYPAPAPVSLVGIPADQFATVPPPEPTVVPVRERPPLSIFVSTGVGFADPGPGPVGTTPPEATVVPLDADRHHLRPALQPVLGQHGFVDSTVVVTPPEAISLDRPEQRSRWVPLAPTAIVGIPADQFAVIISPPGPLFVTFSQRPPVTVSITTGVGFSDPGPGPVGTTPPEPLNVDRADQRVRYKPLEPISISGVLAALGPPAATPPGPYVVPIDQRGRFLVTLPSTGQHGFVDPGPGAVGTTPPPPLNLDRADQRVRYEPLKPLIFSGPSFAPPPPPDLGGVQSQGGGQSPRRRHKTVEEWKRQQDQDEIAIALALLLD